VAVFGRIRGVAAALLALASPAAGQHLDYDLGPPRLDYGAVAEADADGPVREVYFDQIELGFQEGEEAYSWDVSTRIGGPRHRLFLASIGEGVLGGALDYLEFQALYSRAVSEDWDVQAGLRYDFRPHPNRAWLTVGAQGNATEQLYLGGFAFLSHRGEAAARAYALWDIPIVGGLILQPSAEANVFAQDIAALGLGRGLAYGEAGLRLRYRIRESFAPYVGIEWTRDFGRTARFTREAGEDVSGRTLLVGLRSWF
jgi:copper resistance protein B